MKEPAVATRENFRADNYDESGLEKLKLEDGVRMHEHTKVQLDIYARENHKQLVKPFMLVVAKDTTHANDLQKRIEADDFFGGRYKGRVITVHSNQTGRGEGRDCRAAPLRGGPCEPDRDRDSRQHAQGRLGRDEPLHDRPAPHSQFADAR